MKYEFSKANKVISYGLAKTFFGPPIFAPVTIAPPLSNIRASYTTSQQTHPVDVIWTFQYRIFFHVHALIVIYSYCSYMT